jgi:hypothetical protein
VQKDKDKDKDKDKEKDKTSKHHHHHHHHKRQGSEGGAPDLLMLTGGDERSADSYANMTKSASGVLTPDSEAPPPAVRHLPPVVYFLLNLMYFYFYFILNIQRTVVNANNTEKERKGNVKRYNKVSTKGNQDRVSSRRL